MTIEQLNAKRDEILARIGIAKTQFGVRSVTYTDATKDLALLDAEINKVTSSAASISPNNPTPQITLAGFSSD